MIEFNKETHTYKIDGVKVPSVTSIISNIIMPGKYDGIPKEILKDAAEFGTAIHEAIQADGEGSEPKLTKYQEITFKSYMKLKQAEGITPLLQENICHYGLYFIGTYDMIAYINRKVCLVDIKTTSKLDHEYLSWQLGMYKMAIQEEGIETADYFCIWVPKNKKAQLVRVEPKTEEEIMSVLKSEEYIRLCESLEE